MENITTIQIRENVKAQLDRIKVGRESYEEVILRALARNPSISMDG